ncbi:MAG: serine/threonine protein kinase [Myxococcales bacterium]|nr:serine/threonine protein kinase [Myxococcales bacterium]
MVRRLGGGAQAETWLATDTTTGARVALKLTTLLRAASLKDLELWEREAEVLRTLDHPAIPKVVDAFHEEGEHGDQTYVIVQTYVEGLNLSERVASGSRWDEAALCDLAGQALGILDYLHTRIPAVVHRDLKPSNLILSPDGRLWLIDFGAVQSALPASPLGGSTVIGTHGYMPPEQLSGRATPASDLYALGATLIHLASGHCPMALPLERMRITFRHAVSLGGPLCDWLDQMVAPMVEDRVPDARTALERLKGALATSKTVDSARISPPLDRAVAAIGRDARTPKRGVRWGWFGLGAAVVIVIGVGLRSADRGASATDVEVRSDTGLIALGARSGPVVPGAETGGRIPVVLLDGGPPGITVTTQYAHIIALGMADASLVYHGRLDYDGDEELHRLKVRATLRRPDGTEVDATDLRSECFGAALRKGDFCPLSVDLFKTVAGVVGRIELAVTAERLPVRAESIGIPEPSGGVLSSDVVVRWKIASPPPLRAVLRRVGSGRYNEVWVDLVFINDGPQPLHLIDYTARLVGKEGQTLCRTTPGYYIATGSTALRQGDQAPARRACNVLSLEKAIASVEVDVLGFKVGEP